MARLKDHEKALALRKQEMSYSQIKKILGVSKSTLSGWLRDYPLSEQRIKELQRIGARRSEHAIEKFRETMRQKREKRLEETYKTQKKRVLPLNKRELFLAGLFLYWGEGTKCRMDTVGMANSDPSVIKFFITWVTKSLKVPSENLRVQLHLYNDMNTNKELNYWSEELKIPLEQFTRPYIKASFSKRINHKGSFKHGTCKVRVHNVPLAEKIIMTLKAISDQYNKKRT